MQTNYADGDPGAAQFLTVLTLIIFLFSACHKPSSKMPLPPADSLTTTSVKPPHLGTVIKKKSKKKKLYITFDDGPNKGTKNVLHIVQDEAIPVTFFVVGEHVFASTYQQQTWDSLQMADHIAICNHSFSHANQRYSQYYQQPDSVVKDFVRTHDSLHLNNTIARTPGRNIWRVDSLQFTDLKSSKIAADSLANAGFVLMGWDLEWHYNPVTMGVKQSADEMVQQIDSAFARRQMKREDHLVLLAHDQVYNKPDDSAQLRKFIKRLKDSGEYELALATSYPGALKRMKTDSFTTKPVTQ